MSKYVVYWNDGIFLTVIEVSSSNSKAEEVARQISKQDLPYAIKEYDEFIVHLKSIIEECLKSSPMYEEFEKVIKELENTIVDYNYDLIESAKSFPKAKRIQKWIEM